MTRIMKHKLLGSVRRHYSEGEEYTMCVLWIMGYTERAIARVMGLRTKQVAGKISKSDYRNRSDMTDMQRQAKLMELEEIRYVDGEPLDGGVLDRVAWGIIPLGGKQVKGS